MSNLPVVVDIDDRKDTRREQLLAMRKLRRGVERLAPHVCTVTASSRKPGPSDEDPG
jgi:hypothetical protein